MIADIGLWATCEASALHGSRTPARRSAAGWVLELADGGDLEDLLTVAFDRVTPTPAIAKRQAGMVSVGVAREMEKRGWHIQKRSEGWSAYVVNAPGGMFAPGGADGVAVVSLDAVGRSWLDAGGMIASMDRVSFAAVLLLDRAKMSRNGVADVEVTTRPAAGVLHAYRVLAARREAVIEGAAPMHAPGIYCARCRLAGCPVRSLDGPGGVS